MNKSLLRIATVPISLNLLITGQMKYMKGNGFNVTMMSADGPEISEVVENELCRHIVLPLTRQISPLKDLKALILLYQHLKREMPTIVHSHTPKAGLIGMLAAKFANIPVRLHTVAGLPLMTSVGIKKKMLILTEKITSWGAHKVLPNSKSIRDYMKEHNLASHQKLAIIGEGSSNGIDLNRFTNSNLDKKKLLDTKTNFFKDGTLTILAVGRIVKDKGVVEVIEAFERIQLTHPDLHLLLIGPIENERISENLPKEILAKIVNNPSITHISWTNDIEYYMALSDVLVHASHREGFPNVVLQAGAMELPIICSNIPGNIDVVTDDLKGTLFQVKNTHDLVDKLNIVLEKQERAKIMAKNLREFIEDNFDQKKVHQLILEYYKTQLEIAKP